MIFANKGCNEVTGLAGDVARFRDEVDFVYLDDDAKYVLRPETIESLYILYEGKISHHLRYIYHSLSDTIEVTGDPMYREWGWDIFQAIELLCKNEVGYASLHGIQNPNPYQEDYVESFFMGETLKYLYLLFGGGDRNLLDDYVFTTKAHVLKRF